MFIPKHSVFCLAGFLNWLTKKGLWIQILHEKVLSSQRSLIDPNQPDIQHSLDIISISEWLEVVVCDDMVLWFVTTWFRDSNRYSRISRHLKGREITGELPLVV